jgi:hypothetical protein
MLNTLFPTVSNHADSGLEELLNNYAIVQKLGQLWGPCITILGILASHFHSLFTKAISGQWCSAHDNVTKKGGCSVPSLPHGDSPMNTILIFSETSIAASL